MNKMEKWIVGKPFMQQQLCVEILLTVDFLLCALKI